MNLEKAGTLRISLFFMSHACRALILHCIDFRFISAIRDFAVSQGLKDTYDLVSVAGASKNIAQPQAVSDREFVIRQASISQKLHGISEIHVINHTDCGAYGGRSAFDSDDAELLAHQGDLHEAGDILRHEFPELTVHLHLARLSFTDHSIRFEKVR